MPRLNTARLELRPFHADDRDELHALFTDPVVRRYLLDDRIVPRSWVVEEIKTSAARFADVGCGLWCVRERGAHPIIGFVGYRPFGRPRELHLLYGLRPAAQGRGYATEAAAEALRYAFEELGFDDVGAAADVPNAASIRVLERLGLREAKRTEEGVAGTVSFRIVREEWQARTNSHACPHPPAAPPR